MNFRVKHRAAQNFPPKNGLRGHSFSKINRNGRFWKIYFLKLFFSFLAHRVIVPNIMHNVLAKSTWNRVKRPLHLQVSKSTSSSFEHHQDTIRTLPVVANEAKRTLLSENNIKKSVFSWVVPISYRVAWIYVAKKNVIKYVFFTKNQGKSDSTRRSGLGRQGGSCQESAQSTKLLFTPMVTVSKLSRYDVSQKFY